MTPDVVKYLHQLELSPSANWDEVQKAYRDLIRVWHPDRFAQDEALRLRAEQKAKDLNEAIRYLRRHYRKTMLIRRDPLGQADPKSGVHPGAHHAFGGSHRSVHPEFEGTTSGVHSAHGGAAPFFAARRAASFSVFKVAATNFVAFLGMCAGIAALSSVGMPDLHFASASLNDSGVSGSKPSARVAEQRTSPPADRAQHIDSPEHFSQAAANARPAIVQAAMSCNMASLKRLIETPGADVSVTDENGDTALAWAARLNCISGARMLIDSGIDVRNVARNGFTALSWAEWARNNQIADLIRKTPAAGTTARTQVARASVIARPAAH